MVDKHRIAEARSVSIVDHVRMYAARFKYVGNGNWRGFFEGGTIQVNEDRQTFRYGDKGGDVIAFTMMLHNCSVDHAINNILSNAKYHKP